MSENPLQQLLSIEPDREELATRAARARRNALARLGDRQPARRAWLWAPALALTAVLVACAAWTASVWRVQPWVWTPPHPGIAAADLQPRTPAPERRIVRHRTPRSAGSAQRLEVYWALSDGTRVQWTFDRNFSL
jgi:hypothetical protein